MRPGNQFNSIPTQLEPNISNSNSTKTESEKVFQTQIQLKLPVLIELN